MPLSPCKTRQIIWGGGLYKNTQNSPLLNSTKALYLAKCYNLIKEIWYLAKKANTLKCSTFNNIKLKILKKYFNSQRQIFTQIKNIFGFLVRINKPCLSQKRFYALKKDIYKFKLKGER